MTPNWSNRVKQQWLLVVTVRTVTGLTEPKSMACHNEARKNDADIVKLISRDGRYQKLFTSFFPLSEKLFLIANTDVRDNSFICENSSVSEPTSFQLTQLKHCGFTIAKFNANA